MSRSSRRLVGYWDRRAPTYDTKTAGVERRYLADSRRWVCGRARGSTLEIAIGTGANLRHYPRKVELTAVDWSPAMLDAARHRADEVGRTVAFHRADAGALPFPTETFDTVVATFSLCCVPDERAALVEALRVLRPDGNLLLADHVVSSTWWFRAAQRTVELASVPLQGEHYTRRPLTTLAELGVDIEESERLTLGAIERVHARRTFAERLPN
ncbi:class I SAM-dependent methyltransferase [Actinopolymorpha sp. NPDC004070]|uniref:class I SAM-dependent methyltransferase n=1 Tax=Actinopolymorpha sp. NPDC004070 TaxID=3154548 RepID=UPI0033B539B2